MEARLHETREAWLNDVAHRLAPIFQQLAAPLPARLRIAIGFTSGGQRSKRIGECWDNQCSEDRYFEIFIRPDLGQSKDLMPMQVAEILGHELVHAAVGIAAGRGREFRRVAKGIGLVDKWWRPRPAPSSRRPCSLYCKQRERCPTADFI